MQAIHHAEVVEEAQNTATFPGGMLRQVQKITSIKPSSPNETTAEKIKENIQRWMFHYMSILKKHYEEVIATILASLPDFE